MFWLPYPLSSPSCPLPSYCTFFIFWLSCLLCSVSAIPVPVNLSRLNCLAVLSYLSCSSCSVLAVLFLLKCSVLASVSCPGFCVLFWLLCSVLAVRLWLSNRPVLDVLSRLSSSDCPVSCLGCNVQTVTTSLIVVVELVIIGRCYILF
jgi:hypothetical protein